MQARAALTLEKIDGAALALFAEKGVDRTTIGDIAQAAGIAEGTIYRHYPSKDELVWQLFSRNYLALAGRLESLQAERKGLKAKLRAMVGLFCRLYEEDPNMFRFLLLVQHGQLPRIAPGTKTPVTVLREVLRRAMAEGEIALRDPQVATAMVLGMVLQVAVFKVYERVTQPLDALADSLAEACWRALAPQAIPTERS